MQRLYNPLHGLTPLGPEPWTSLCRDSLAKILYSKMFDWLVAAINTAIGEDKDCAASVGVLDIYGFESFEYNDLEQVRVAQLCWCWWWRWLPAAARHGGDCMEFLFCA